QKPVDPARQMYGLLRWLREKVAQSRHELKSVVDDATVPPDLRHCPLKRTFDAIRRSEIWHRHTCSAPPFGGPLILPFYKRLVCEPKINRNGFVAGPRPAAAERLSSTGFDFFDIRVMAITSVSGKSSLYADDGTNEVNVCRSSQPAHGRCE